MSQEYSQPEIVETRVNTDQHGTYELNLCFSPRGKTYALGWEMDAPRPPRLDEIKDIVVERLGLPTGAETVDEFPDRCSADIAEPSAVAYAIEKDGERITQPLRDGHDDADRVLIEINEDVDASSFYHNIKA